MNLTIRLKMMCLCYIIFIASSPSSIAQSNPRNNIAEEESEVENNRAGGYLRIGYGYEGYSGPVRPKEEEFSLLYDARYQWANGLFVEASANNDQFDNQSGPHFGLGYNFLNTNHWSFDLLTAPTHGGIRVGLKDSNDAVFKETIEQTISLGLRSSAQYGRNFLQFTLMPITLNNKFDNGVYASAWINRQWQLRNWNLSTSLGVQYRSEEILSSYWGLPLEGAAIDLPSYEADGGINAIGQVRLSYPINKDWVFESFFRQTQLSDSIIDSPIIDSSLNFDQSRRKSQSEFGIHVYYVF